MKAYTFFTDSHEDILKKHFIPSFPFSDGIELNIKHFPQIDFFFQVGLRTDLL